MTHQINNLSVINDDSSIRSIHNPETDDTHIRTINESLSFLIQLSPD